MNLQSLIICSDVQELPNGSLNYIEVSNEFFGTGVAEFSIVSNYLGNKDNFEHKIEIMAPSGELSFLEKEVIDMSSFRFYTSVMDVDVEFNELGEYKVNVLANNRLLGSYVIIINED